MGQAAVVNQLLGERKQGQYGQHNAKDYKRRPVEDVDLIIGKVRLHGMCPCQAYVQGWMLLEFTSTLRISPLSLRIRRPQKYGIFQYQILLHNGKVAQHLGGLTHGTSNPYKESLKAIVLQHSNHLYYVSGDVEGHYDLYRSGEPRYCFGRVGIYIRYQRPSPCYFLAFRCHSCLSLRFIC